MKSDTMFTMWMIASFFLAPRVHAQVYYVYPANVYTPVYTVGNPVYLQPATVVTAVVPVQAAPVVVQPTVPVLAAPVVAPVLAEPPPPRITVAPEG